MLFFAVFTASLFLTALAHSSHHSRGSALPSVITKCTGDKQVAITFDDGPYDYMKEVLKSLDQYKAKATFFFNGNNFRCIYYPQSMEYAQLAYHAGHQIGSHTWHHYDLATLNADELHDEMSRVELALQRVLGVTPAYMRPPFGSYNDLVRSVATQRGQTVVIWDFDSMDTHGKTPAQSNVEYDNKLKAKPKNVLTLNHETHVGTVRTVLPHILKTFHEKGYKFVTVADCLGNKVKPYQSTNKIPAYNATWATENC